MPTGIAARRRAVTGALAEPVGPSSAMRFEAQAALEVILDDPDGGLFAADLAGLAQGANRLLLGNEIVQFARVQPLGEARWRLTGLLRGRGGTEWAAAEGHAVGTAVALLDSRLVELDARTLDMARGGGFAALGATDDAPAEALLEGAGESLRPPSPVHGRITTSVGGGLDLRWTRRARGQWRWPDQVDQPLVEQEERYEVGIGDPDTPLARWIVDRPHLAIDTGSLAGMRESNRGAPIWVRQSGSLAASRPLRIGELA